MYNVYVYACIHIHTYVYIYIYIYYIHTYVYPNVHKEVGNPKVFNPVEGIHVYIYIYIHIYIYREIEREREISFLAVPRAGERTQTMSPCVRLL